MSNVMPGLVPGMPVLAASEIVINRKTATALGLEIPPKLLFTVGRVIE
jgi:hypothetical protein